MDKDLGFYRECLEALKRFSPDAAVFLLVHKMDLARENKKERWEKKNKEIEDASGDTAITVFGTSIYDESLYKVRCISFDCKLVLKFTRPGPASYIHSFLTQRP